MTPHPSSVLVRIGLVLGLAVLAAACSEATGRAPDLSSKVELPADTAVSPKVSVQKLNYTFGPFKLPAHMAATSMAKKAGELGFHVEAPLWVTAFEPKLANAKGVALDNHLVQAIVLFNNHEPNTVCTKSQTGNPFAAATSGMKRVDLPEGYGYPLLPEDPLEASITLRNPTDEDINDVYISFTLTAEPMDVASHKKDVLPMLLSNDPCGLGTVSLPPNGMVQKSASFSTPEDGSVVMAYGLLQDYGVSVAVAAGSDLNKPFWSAMSKLNGNHEIVDLPDFDNPKGVPLKKGDAVSLGVVYDNFSNNWINDATAAAMVYMAPDGTPSLTNPSSNGDSHQPVITASKAASLILN